MNVAQELLAELLLFGAVLLLGVTVFRLMLETGTGPDAAAGGARWVAAVCTGVVLFSLCIVFGWTHYTVLFPLVGAGSYLAFRVPVWLRLRKSRQRASDFRRGLVELTVGLANGLRGGGALGQTLGHVARDLRGVVAEEVDQLLDENKVGVEFADCFDRMQQRMPSEDMALLATAIRLTLSTGGSLAEVLEKMTSMMRERHDFDERLRTMTAQGRFEAMAMGLAPLAAFGILFLIDRSMVEPLYLTVPGRLAVGVVVVLESIGFYVINKIVTIEV